MFMIEGGELYGEYALGVVKISDLIDCRKLSKGKVAVQQ